MNDVSVFIFVKVQGLKLPGNTYF